MNRSKKKALRTIAVATLQTIRGGNSGQLGTVKFEDIKLTGDMR